MTSEHDVLLGFLRGQRRHVLGAVEGLSGEQLRKPVLPSGWHCLGMIKHLSLADELYWFRYIVAGEDVSYPEETEWEVADGEDVFSLYKDAADRSDAIIAAAALDAPPRRPDPQWKEWGVDFPDVRTIMLHVITETATHAGHLDAARELLDGKQWIVMG
jgi:Protein of unknown function (DUF664)